MQARINRMAEVAPEVIGISVLRPAEGVDDMGRAVGERQRARAGGL